MNVIAPGIVKFHKAQSKIFKIIQIFYLVWVWNNRDYDEVWTEVKDDLIWYDKSQVKLYFLPSWQCQPIIKALRDLQSQAGKVKRTCEVPDIPAEVMDAVKRFVKRQLLGTGN